jgi:hypothetical protein
MKLFSLMVLITIFSGFGFANAAESYRTQVVDLNFDSVVRVEIVGRVVEASDSSPTGGSLTLIQSLQYSGSKKLLSDESFSKLEALKAAIRARYCNETFQVQMTPYRNSGTKAVDPYDSKLKPSSMTVYGRKFAKGETAFQETISCK